jgi:hypothetical protein
MPLAYSKNKVHIYKWVENNRDQHNEICKKYQRKYDAWKRETKKFRNILIDFV